MKRPHLLVALGAFVAHNAEEALAMPHYSAQLVALLSGPLGHLAGAVTPVVFAAGALIVSVVAALVTVWAYRRPRSRMACWSALLVQAVVLLNVVPHVAAAIVLGGYAPGLVTAVAVTAPFSMYVLGRAWREAWVDRRAFGVMAVAAVVVHGPLLWILLRALTVLTRS